jgi:putative aldouronate transport system substrate-binding protein
MKFFKAILVTLLLVLAVGMLTACRSDDAGPASTPTPAVTPPAATPAPLAPVATPPPDVEFSYPMDTNVTVTWWKETAGNWAPFLAHYGESAFSRALIEMTGVNIEWIHPPSGQAPEAFGIMVASGNFPDIVEWAWTAQFPGGAIGAIQDGVIIPLCDAKAQWAPNYMRFLYEHPHIHRQVVTDEGTHFAFPFLRADDILKTTTGPIVRLDWLDQLGLDIPETIEDWEEMLFLFRDEMGATHGFTGQHGQGDPNGILNTFLPAFGIRANFFVEGNQIVYGQTHPAFRDFLELMAFWYSERLVHPDIFSITRAEMDAALLTGQSGAVIGPGGGALGPWLQAAWANDPGTSFDLTATRFPTFDSNVLTRHGGTSNDLADGSRGHAAITTSAREIEVITRLLDFAFSEEGHMLYNFGPYGVSWNWVNGVPIYTDIVTNNPDGRSFAQALTYFARGAFNGPFNQDPWYLIQFYALPQQEEALTFWREQDNPEATVLPPLSFTPAEASTIQSRMADIDTYRREQIALFVTGARPINDDTWNTFVNNLNNMGVPEVRDIHQRALERFLAR